MQCLTRWLILLPNNICLKAYDSFVVEASVVLVKIIPLQVKEVCDFRMSCEFLQAARTAASVNVGFLCLQGFVLLTSC